MVIKRLFIALTASFICKDECQSKYFSETAFANLLEQQAELFVKEHLYEMCNEVYKVCYREIQKV